VAKFFFQHVIIYDPQMLWPNMQIFSSQRKNCSINPLKTKRRPLYLKTQSVPLSKHFSSRL